MKLEYYEDETYRIKTSINDAIAYLNSIPRREGNSILPIPSCYDIGYHLYVGCGHHLYIYIFTNITYEIMNAMVIPWNRSYGLCEDLITDLPDTCLFLIDVEFGTMNMWKNDKVTS